MKRLCTVLLGVLLLSGAANCLGVPRYGLVQLQQPKLIPWSPGYLASIVDCPEVTYERPILEFELPGNPRGLQGAPPQNLFEVEAPVTPRGTVPQEELTDCWAAVVRSGLVYFGVPLPSRANWEAEAASVNDGATIAEMRSLFEKFLPGSLVAVESHESLVQPLVPKADLVDNLLDGKFVIMIVRLLEPNKYHAYMLKKVRYSVISAIERRPLVSYFSATVIDPAGPEPRLCTLTSTDLETRLEGILYVGPLLRSEQRPRCLLRRDANDAAVSRAIESPVLPQLEDEECLRRRQLPEAQIRLPL